MLSLVSVCLSVCPLWGRGSHVTIASDAIGQLQVTREPTQPWTCVDYIDRTLGKWAVDIRLERNFSPGWRGEGLGP